MKNNRIQLTLTVLLLAALACSFPASGGEQPVEWGSPPPTGNDQPTIPSPQPPVQRNPCDNPYFPVKQGATWNYTSTSESSGTFTYTDTVTSVRADGFTLTGQIGGVNRTQEWSCKPEGLLALQLGGAGPSAAVTASGVNAQLTTSNVQGVTIPADPQPGAQWTYSLDLQGTATIAEGMTGEINGTASSNAQALAMETVSVPAGTFNALKVQVNTTFSFTMNVQGLAIPVAITGVSYMWYAPGVGLVKSEDTGDFNGTTFSSTTELQSYVIP